MSIVAETKRLILREILPTDIDGMFELEADSEVHRYLGNNPVKDKDQIVELINYIRRQYIDNGIGRLAIIDKKTNAFIGWTGLKLETKLTNNHKNYYDLGYRIIKKYWGQGIGTETAIASLDYGFNNLHLTEIYAAANCENIGSNKIIQKVGFKFIETFYYEEILCNWYKMDRSIYNSTTLTRVKEISALQAAIINKS